MLRQEINLYRQFSAPDTDAAYFTWKRYWILNLVFACLMMLIYMFSLMQTVYSRHEDKALKVELANYQAEFKKLKDTFPQLFFSENINESVANLKKQMAAQHRIIDILSKHSPFSDILMALSRTIIPNVWLNTMVIDKDGDVITLNGDSLGMGHMNEYIASLEKDTTFQNYSVIVHEVKNTDVHDTNTRLTFEINMAKKKNE